MQVQSRKYVYAIDAVGNITKFNHRVVFQSMRTAYSSSMT